MAESCSHRDRFSSPVARMLGVRPGEGLGARSSPLRRRLSQRLRVESETPKSLVASRLGVPWSTAPNTLTLRSFE